VQVAVELLVVEMNWLGAHSLHLNNGHNHNAEELFGLLRNLVGFALVGTPNNLLAAAAVGDDELAHLVAPSLIPSM
jgi:hypothetical protein